MKLLTKNTQAYTMTEVVLAVVIIGVIASQAIPNFMNTMERSRAAEGLEILSILRESQLYHRTETGSLAETLSALDVTIPTPKYFILPTDSQVNTSDPIASITRNGSLYTLSIDIDGTLNCSGSDCAKTGISP